jgi:vacuolar-type H+-ATPase subunit C/Vma6
MMVRAGERAYVYAKTCGIIGKSFVGRRIGALGPAARLSELDRLVFASGARELPERELLPDIEKRIIRRSVDAAVSIVGCFARPPELFILLVQSYECADLKTALASLKSGEIPAAKPSFTNIGRFGTVNFGAWPDLKAMLKGTDYVFALKDAASGQGPENSAAEAGDSVIASETALETAIDQHYYRKLWKALFALKKNDRRAAEKIIREEISLRNAAWALRLRAYYGMDGGEVRKYLIAIPGHEELAKAALDALKLPLDSRREWEKWAFADYLNGEGAGVWRADPRFFQNAAAGRLYRLALHHFRRNPLSLDTVFCFIKLKQFEEDLLTSAAEGLGLGMSSRDVFDLLEVSS